MDVLARRFFDDIDKDELTQHFTNLKNIYPEFCRHAHYMGFYVLYIRKDFKFYN